jgi:hypothetical protein
MNRAIHYSGFDRTQAEHYPTPAWVTKALLRHVQFRGKIWEPCCGDGSIADVLMGEGYPVHATDLFDYGYGEPGRDVFDCLLPPEGCEAIVTNPPYGDGSSQRLNRTRTPRELPKFVRHVLKLASTVRGQVALLVRLQWIAGKGAASLLNEMPLEKVIILAERIQWFYHGERTNAGQHNHVWLVFDFSRPADAGPPRLIFEALANRREYPACLVCRTPLPPERAKESTCSPQCARRLAQSSSDG